PGRRRVDPRDLEPTPDEWVSNAGTGAGTTPPGRFAVKRLWTAIAALLVAVSYHNVRAGEPPPGTRDEAVDAVERHRQDLVGRADRIGRCAETALRERRSAAALADYAERQGFRVERGVAGLPTAFVATYGEGRPIIGLLGEYDALPGLSQKAQPTEEALAQGAPGPGCGHNLLGSAARG